MARFRREALAAARLQHPNVVQVFDSGEDPGSHRHYIVMEYVDGPSCADMLRDQKLLDVDESVRIVRDACHGLDYAHRAGVVHRDVKPGNLLVAERQPHHQAGRLRHRQGRRADAHHPGRLGARHRRLPLPRAGARRGGRAGLGHLLAGRVRLPVPGRAAAARVLVAHRAGAQAAGGGRRADHRAPARGAAPSSTARSACAWPASPRRATPPRWRWRERWTPGIGRRGDRRDPAPRRRRPRRHPRPGRRDGRHPGAAHAAAPRRRPGARAPHRHRRPRAGPAGAAQGPPRAAARARSSPCSRC